MNEVVIKPKTVVRFKIEDRSYDVKRPTLGRASQLQDDIKEAEKLSAKQVTEILVVFLAELGLPPEVTRELEKEQLDQVVEALQPKKKS